MAMSPKDAAQWLAAARAGSSEALGEALEACRLYLLGIAERELDGALQAKGGASDLVQQTFLEAQQAFGQFDGANEAELLAWLRRLLLNNLASFARRYRGTDKRALNRERALPALDSSTHKSPSLPAAGLTPSGALMRDEEEEALQRALAALPADYRQVIALRYDEDLSFEEIAVRMERSANAARKIWLRAVERLQRELDQSP